LHMGKICGLIKDSLYYGLATRLLRKNSFT
jgi:hypothetical protein